MFIVQCPKCNRTVEWKTGSQFGRMVVSCASGHSFAEDAGQDAEQ